MGGFASALGDAIGESAGRLEAKIAPEIGPAVRRAITENIAPMETSFKNSKAGMAIFDRYNNSFRPTAEKVSAEAFSAAAKGKPMLNAEGEQLIEPHKIRVHARNTAREAAFGEKDEGFGYLLTQAKKEKGDIHANTLSDHLGILFHDTAYEDAGGKRANTLTRNIYAYSKRGAKDSAERANAFTAKNPEPYKAPTPTEAKTKRYMLTTLAPHAAIAHSASSLLTFMADGLASYSKAVASTIKDYEGAREFLKTTNAIAELHFIEYIQHFEYERSKFKESLNTKFPWIPNSVGEILHANRSMPGMSAVRKWNLTVAGMSAKFHVQTMAAKLMNPEVGFLGELNGGNEYVESELRRFKLDPDKIRAQGGHLSDEDLRTAIFHGTDYSAFLENSMHRSSISQATMAGRTSMALHTYITRSSRAISGSIWKEIANKNPVGIARTMGTLLLIAPEIGNGLEMIEKVASGHGVKKPYEDWKDEERSLHGQNGFAELLTSHVGALSHIGAFGVATGYTRGMARSKLMDSLAGPLPNMGVTLTEDIYKFFFDAHHPGKAVGRDTLEDIPTLGLGGIAAHLILPTKAEISASKPKTARQLKAARTRAMHKRSY